MNLLRRGKSIVRPLFAHCATEIGPAAPNLHVRLVDSPRRGRLCIGRRKINLSAVFAGQNVGIEEVAEIIWLVSFMHYDLGFFDHEAGRFECVPNPFETKVLPMCPE